MVLTHVSYMPKYKAMIFLRIILQKKEEGYNKFLYCVLC